MGRAVQDPAYFQPRNHLRGRLVLPPDSPAAAPGAPNPAPRGAAPLRWWGGARGVVSVSPARSPGSPAVRPEPRVPADGPAGPGGSRLGGGGARRGWRLTRAGLQDRRATDRGEGPGAVAPGPPDRSPCTHLPGARPAERPSPRAQPRGSRPPPAARAMLPRGSG